VHVRLVAGAREVGGIDIDQTELVDLIERSGRRGIAGIDPLGRSALP
jgi:hypothetical protein